MGLEKNLRREKRIPIRIPLMLNGKTDKGFTINSSITTENISKNGICFKMSSPVPVKPGDSIYGEMKNYKFQTNCALKVIWKKGNTLGGYLVQKPTQWFIT